MPGFAADADGGSFLAPQLDAPGANVALTFNLPANRSYPIETSTDLQTWTLWDVLSNAGLPHNGGPTTVTGPRLGERQFFRLQVRED